MNDFNPNAIAKRYVAMAVKAPSGKWNAVYAPPGLKPYYVSVGGTVLEFDNKQEAENRAREQLFIGLNNRPNHKNKQEDYEFLTGAEFAVKLADADLSPTVFAFIYNTDMRRINYWLDGVERIPHPVNVLLELFIKDPENIDVAEDFTEQITRRQHPKLTNKSEPIKFST